jgi:hypothetical protein
LCAPSASHTNESETRVKTGIARRLDGTSNGYSSSIHHDGAAMKVDVNRSKRRTQYRLKAKTIKKALAELNGRANADWATFAGTLKGEVSFSKATGQALSVQLEVSYEINMPSWPAYPRQSTQVKTSWDNMYKALEKHEEGHLALFQKDAGMLRKKLEGLGAKQARDVKKIIDDANTEAQKQQDAYDDRTNHGRDTVRLYIPPEEEQISSEKPKPTKKKQRKKQKGGAQPEKS